MAKDKGEMNMEAKDNVAIDKGRRIRGKGQGARDKEAKG